MEVYFDNGATTKPDKDIIDEVAYAMAEYYGNPSSLHTLGLKCSKKLMESKESIGRIINASKEEIYFTSGGSESNNTILRGVVKSGNSIITTRFEHSSVLNTCNELEAFGVKVTYLDVDSKGFINLEDLKNSLNKDTVLVSIMHVNNEVGSIQNLKEIGKIIKENSKRAKFHVDGVQGYGKLRVDVKECNIDFYTASAHKLHGPKGVGFCYIRKGLKPLSLITGGSQEFGVRAGTENLPGYLGMVKASEIAYETLEENYNHVKELKKYFINKLEEFHYIRINSPLEENISSYILNVSFLGVRAEVLLHLLEEKHIFISTGSACSSKAAVSKGSHVLNAIGMKEKEIESAIRFSFCKYNTKEEVDYVIDILKQSLKFLRRIKR